jgi:uncharacterized membrane protein
MLIAAVITLVVLLICKVKLEYIFLVTALMLGTIMMFVITPLSPPDEMIHYTSSYALSGYLIFDDNPMLADVRHFDYRGLTSHENDPDAYLRLMSEGVFRLEGTAETYDISSIAGLHYPLSYLPQAIGIAIARLLNLSFLGVFYFGRFFNLLFYMLCVFFSIKRLKAFRLPFFIIALLPMTLQLAASFSYDTFILGVSTLFIVYAISIVHEMKTFRWRDFIVLLILAILMATFKAVYLPLLLLLIFVMLAWIKENKRKGLTMVGIIVTSVVLVFLYFSREVMSISGDGLNWEGHTNYTTSFIITYPIETIRIFINTLRHYGDMYFYGIFGHYLSGLTMLIPKYYIFIIVLFLIISLFYGKKDEWQPTIPERFTYAFISVIIIGLCMLAMFLGWTSDFRNIILGVQGRYFLPVLPLILLMFKNNIVVFTVRFYRNFILVGYTTLIVRIIFYVVEQTVISYNDW